MKNLITSSLSALVLIFAIAAFSFGASFYNTQIAKADSGEPNYFPLSSTTPPFALNTNVGLAAGVSTRVLATSTARVFAYLSTASTTAFCNLSDAPATLGGGFVIGSSSMPFKIDLSDLYIGSIQCVSASAGSVSVSAYQ